MATIAEARGARRTSISNTWRSARRYLTVAWPLYVMFLPVLVQLAIFHYYPMYGLVIAFKNYNPGLGFGGSPWVGLENFARAFNSYNFVQVMRNTFTIAMSKIVLGQVSAVVLALLLNEARSIFFRRTLQSIVYLPHFLSWVVLAGILLDLLSSAGLVNRTLRSLGLSKPILFLGDNHYFVPTVLVSYLWQRTGWSTIIYLAALTAIDPQLHEAAAIDGANRWQRMLHVTLPGMRSTVMLAAILSVGNILQAGFDQILNLYNPVVYRTGDIIDTYVYRQGLVQMQYSLATAVGLFKSVMGFVLILISYWLADKYSDYRVF